MGGPMHDLRMGFYKAAPYYYYPGWHEPGTCLEVMFNKKAYDELPKDLQAIIDAVAMETNFGASVNLRRVTALPFRN